MSSSAIESVTDDAFLGGRLHILQSKTGLRAGVDAVFLAAAVPLKVGHAAHVLDVGTGCGVVGLSVLARNRSCQLNGIDINAELIALAEHNAKRNDLTTQARFHRGDVRNIAATMDACGLAPNSFDHVIANPPFFEEGTVQHAPAAIKDRANVMRSGDLDLWVRFMTHTARAQATLTIIHRAEALSQLLAALDGRFGALNVFPLFPRAGHPASRIIVQGQKGARTAMALQPGLILHEDDGRFTQRAEQILRHGAALSLNGKKTAST